jgi:antitoxin (DNA-binding transcriptional repressor) of toxin-antitoxin stability system
MHTATVEEVQSRLPELLNQMGSNGEVVIVSDGKPVGRLMPPPLTPGVPILGRGKGKLIHYIEDDEHLRDFEEYMP